MIEQSKALIFDADRREAGIAKISSRQLVAEWMVWTKTDSKDPGRKAKMKTGLK